MELFQYGFILRGFLAGLIIAVICPLIGTFLVLRRMSLIGSALSHISMTGVAAGLMFGISPTVGAITVCLLGGATIEFLRRNFSKYAELAVAITMSAGIGMAVLLISAGNLNNATVMSYLFGSIITTTKSDVGLIATTGLLVIITVILYYSKLVYLAFDEEGAYYAGVNTGLINTMFILLTGLTVAVSIRIVGILLVSPLMTIPVAASLQLARSFRQAVVIAVTFALISVTSGIIASYYLDLAPGGTIIIIALLILFLSILIRKITDRLKSYHQLPGT